jgi:hypothetical protein
MNWLGHSLLGPGIWAAGFSAVYALHGTGCARGWPAVDGVAGINLHLMAMSAAWISTLALGTALLATLPHAQGGAPLSARLPRAGALIGLGATVFTLFPVIATSSCGA